jgi:hypothetical protein
MTVFDVSWVKLVYTVFRTVFDCMTVFDIKVLVGDASYIIYSILDVIVLSLQWMI